MTLRHNKTIIQMVKDGWNFNEIRELFSQSKAFERDLVRERSYFEQHKIDDFSNINSYYCTKHHVFHNKYRYITVKRFSDKTKTKTKTFTKTFAKCKEYAIQLNKSEQFNFRFKKNWNKYNINEHKKKVGSRLQ